MSKPETDLIQLQLAVREAWNTANLVGAAGPAPGTEEWNRWMELIAAAIAARDTYVAALNADQ